MNDLLADLDVIKKCVGMTSLELNHARQMAQTLKRQQEQSAKDLASQLAAKANSSDVQEAASRLAELQQDSEAKYGDVSGELTGIKHDLVATRDDFGRQLVD